MILNSYNLQINEMLQKQVDRELYIVLQINSGGGNNIIFNFFVFNMNVLKCCMDFLKLCFKDKFL